MKKIILSIDGMTCSACSNGLEKYLNKQEGVISCTVNLVMATASIKYDDDLSINDLEKFIENAGFKSLGVAKLDDNKKISIKPYIIYGIVGILLMYISMAKMLNLPYIKIIDMHNSPKSYSMILLVLTIPFIFFGYDILKNGINNLIHKMPNMDTLVSLGVISSFGYSLVNVILVLFGHSHAVHNLYFESTAFVLYFIKVGRFVDKTSKQKTMDAIKGLVSITPKSALLKTKDGLKEITIDEVKKDDILVCMPGEKISVDGILTKGTTHIDESFITGESKPVLKNKNDKVIAGSINFEGKIEYQAKKIGKESTISEIVNLVVEATNTKTSISLLADKISSYFVPIILVIAIITLFVNLFMGINLFESLKRFISVLVVSCPCALGLATPLAIVVGEGICAKRGILVKSSKTFEIANKVDTVVFDKTGILTKGELSISKIYNYSKMSDKKLLELLANIELNSTHPIAKCIKKYYDDKNKQEFNIEEIPGYGIKATNKKDMYYACNGKLMIKNKIENNHIDEEKILTEKGNTIVYLVKNDKILGLFGIKDVIRNEAKTVINKLLRDKKEIYMLTGDNIETANIIGKELNIKNIVANVLPSEKASEIRKLKNDDKTVIMVGDGINDAPSLTLSDIGISIGSATEIASNSADVILVNDDLTKIVDLLSISKKILLNIKENLFWAFLYNIIMIPIAAGIFSFIDLNINPMMACLAMILSSMFVTLNVLRLKFSNNK